MSDIYAQVGEKIRRFREWWRFSQQQLAEMVGTTANTISRWETGTYKPGLDDLEKLAAAFGTHVSVLIPAPEQTPLQALDTVAGRYFHEDDADMLLTFATFLHERRAKAEAAP